MIDPSSIMTAAERGDTLTMPVHTTRSETTISMRPPDLVPDTSSAEESQDEDEGPLTMSRAEIRVIRRLSARTNVLPVIARADSLPDEKLLAVKNAGVSYLTSDLRATINLHLAAQFVPASQKPALTLVSSGQRRRRLIPTPHPSDRLLSPFPTVRATAMSTGTATKMETAMRYPKFPKKRRRRTVRRKQRKDSHALSSNFVKADTVGLFRAPGRVGISRKRRKTATGRRLQMRMTAKASPTSASRRILWPKRTLLRSCLSRSSPQR